MRSYNFFFFALLFIMTPALLATTVVPMSVEELTSAADTVVRGHAVENWSAWNPEHTLIYTFTRFQVDQSYKGKAESTITVRQMGGSADGYTQHVSGVQRWSIGESAVLFLRPSEATGNFAVVGLMQGDFRLHRASSGETLADNGIHLAASHDVKTLNTTTNQVGDYNGSQLKLSELEGRIHAAMKGNVQ